jgi:hypothetical protein
MHADGGVAFGKEFVEQLAGVDLHEGDHGRGGENAELAATDVQGGVLGLEVLKSGSLEVW